MRGAVYGAVAGGWFGLVGVLIDAVATTWQRSGPGGLTHPGGWVPLACLLLVGAAALVLTQFSFQVGSLAATFPANEATAPVVAVALGAALLHERLPCHPNTWRHTCCVPPWWRLARRSSPEASRRPDSRTRRKRARSPRPRAVDSPGPFEQAHGRMAG